MRINYATSSLLLGRQGFFKGRAAPRMLSRTVRRKLVDYASSPLLGGSAAGFSLKTFPAAILSSMPHLPDMGEFQRNTLYISLNNMLNDAFCGDDDLSIVKALSIDGGLADLSDPSRLSQNTKLEFAIDKERKTPAGMIVHQVFQSEKHGAIFYHPKLWAIRSAAISTDGERGYTGLGLIPLLIAKFAFCLQLTYPDRPCYMVIPTYTPWVLRMVRKRFGVPLTSFKCLTDEERALRDEAMALIGLKTSCTNKEGYPLYDLPLHVNYGQFDNTHHHNASYAIKREEAFCEEFLVPEQSSAFVGECYNRERQQFTQYGFVAVVPCSVKVVKHFEESILRSTADYTRIFKRSLPPEHLFLDPGEKSPFLHDVAELFYFGQKHHDGVLPVSKPFPDIDTSQGIKLRLKRTKHLFDHSSSTDKPVPPANQKIERFSGKPVHLRNKLARTEIKVKLNEGSEPVSVYSEVYHVCEIAEQQLPVLLDQLVVLLKDSFKGGDSLRREVFQKRFNRPHTYIELFYDSKGYVIGFVFHEPFELMVHTKEKPDDPLRLIILKTGISCFSEKYQRCGMATFFIRRFLLRLQIEFPGTPCFHHFIASSPGILKSELELQVVGLDEQARDFDLFLNDFYPRPSAGDALIERGMLLVEQEFTRATFCKEIRLKFDMGGAAFSGMFAHIRKLPIGIPYPVVPHCNSSPNQFVNQLFVNASKEMENNAKKYGMPIAEEVVVDGKKEEVELLSPGIRVYSRLSERRATAYANDELYPNITVPGGAVGHNKLLSAVGLWCRSRKSKEVFDTVVGQFDPGGDEPLMSCITPSNQTEARDPSWPDCAKNSGASSISMRAAP